MIEREEGGGLGATAKRIAELKEELGRVEGTPTEVYSRIVGYYRSVRNWNAGKRDEYGQRLNFEMPALGGSAGAAAAIGEAAREDAPEGVPPEAAHKPFARAAVAAPAVAAPAEARKPAETPRPDGAMLRNGILVFTREACPNCSPVANYVMGAGLDAVFVDVDREEGFELARSFGVMATPTVLGIDGEGRESFRAFGVGELRERVEKPVAPRPC